MLLFVYLIAVFSYYVVYLPPLSLSLPLPLSHHMSTLSLLLGFIILTLT